MKNPIQVNTYRRSTNKNGKFSSVFTSNTDTGETKMVTQNIVKGDKGKYRSASLKKNEYGAMSGNFVKGEKGKYLTGARAERKFSRLSTRMNRKK